LLDTYPNPNLHSRPPPPAPPQSPQDFLTAAFYLTSKDRFFSRSQVAQLAAYAGDARDDVDLPPPAIFKPQVGFGVWGDEGLHWGFGLGGCRVLGVSGLGVLGFWGVGFWGCRIWGVVG